MPILFVMNSGDWQDFVLRAFRESGSFFDTTKDVSEAFLLAQSEDYNIIIVERVLDHICGISFLEFMRKNGVQTPVIMLSTSKCDEDALLAFEAGADDFVRWPVSSAELAARVDAIQRRGRITTTHAVLTVGDLSMDRLTRKVRRGAVEIQLQPRTYDLLEVLMEKAGRIVTRSALLETVWGYHFDPRSSVIETHISRLRDRIDRPFDVPLVQTIRGGGYMIGEPALERVN